MRSAFFLAGLLVSTAGLGACATMPDSSDPVALEAWEEANDPLEPLNRYFFELTSFGDFLLLRPLAEIYKGVTPRFVRQGVGNVVSNLSEPVTFVNDLLQGEPRRAAQSFWRFGINSTIGLAGLFDVASMLGVGPHREDFGQTLGVYGMPQGPYIFIPFMGPSSVRDFIGRGASLYGGHYLDPFEYIGNSDTLSDVSAGISGLGLLNTRAAVVGADRDFQRTTLDAYTAFRQFYRQSRRNQVRNGRLDISDLPEISDDLFDDDEDF